MAADALARADRAWLSRLITRRVPLARFAEAFEHTPGRHQGRASSFAHVGCHAEPHRGLRADRRLRERRAGLARRLDRLAVLAALRFGRLLRRAARHAASTAASASRRSDDVTRITRRYRTDTLILETTLRDRGRRRHADRLHADPRHAIRTACASCVGERGRVPMCAELILRFGYGATVPWVRKLGDGTLRAIAGPDMVVLRTPVHLRGENLTTVGEFTVGEGDRVPFVLSYGPSHLPRAGSRSTPTPRCKDTESFWQEWTRKGHVHGPWKDAVTRSLITLKALTYGPTGGIVAAPTTSLPERIGGDAQLGLSLLLAARRDAHAARADERRLLRGSAALARLAARAPSPGSPEQLRDHVRRRGRAAADRMGSALAARLRELARRCASATRRTTSFSSMCSAR